MIKNLPEELKLILLFLFNKIWTEGNIPEQWKIALLIPIPKFGKSERLLQSYRPISLLPCIGKVLERMVTNRLYWYVEKNLKLSGGQSGFRRRCNTSDQVARLEKVVRETYLEKSVCLVVFIDLKSAYDVVNHRILLNKLLEIGVKGQLLSYCASFLQERKFEVFYNGEKSDVKNANTGVPQGAAISPLLFNIFISDIPNVQGVTRTEYADDLAFIVKDKSITNATTKMQEAIDQFYQYITKNKQKINYQKTVGMIFTRKNVLPLPLKINGYNIDFVQEYKFLGITFDSPNLNYSKHINKIKADCISRINVMKAISHNKWGADREMLIKVYDALVASKLNFGAEFYSSACKTTLNTLNVIQNTCLAIAVGARKTSPINSLESETNRPPLEIQRMKIVIDYYNRHRNLPTTLNAVTELRRYMDHQILQPWTSSTPPPVLVRAHKHIINLNINELDINSIPLVNQRPPCQEFNEFDLFMKDIDMTGMNNREMNGIFINKTEIYNNHIKIYTDGSKTSSDQPKTGAAFVVPEINCVRSWKLPNISIMSAELFAIFMSIQWFQQETDYRRGVIFSDSLSSIMLLKNNTGKKPNIYKYKIHKIMDELTDDNREITVKWIPSHKGIIGNEKADKAAKTATNANIITIPNITKLDAKLIIKHKITNLWNELWHANVNVTNTGQHLLMIREKVGKWPWASSPNNRPQETIMARLRIGHCGLNNHLYRFGLTGSPLCNCGVPESVTHYLLECALHNNHRLTLCNVLAPHSVNMTLQNILGGGNYSSKVQKIIKNSVWQYIVNTGKNKSI
jgi:ribonuclease HI